MSKMRNKRSRNCNFYVNVLRAILTVRVNLVTGNYLSEIVLSLKSVIGVTKCHIYWRVNNWVPRRQKIGLTANKQ